MGTIFKRGTRANPRFYFQYREGRLPNGRPRYTTHAATGARTMDDARKQLALVETRISQGLPAFVEPPPRVCEPEPEPEPDRAGSLLAEWRDGLANRSAADDRSRIDRHLIPKFGDLAMDKITPAVVMRWLDELRKTKLSEVEHLVQVTGYSYPSGHSLAAAALYLTMAIVAGAQLRTVASKTVLFAGASLLVALVGISRVYLGVHYPSDVLSGIALGTAWALILSALIAVVVRRRRA